MKDFFELQENLKEARKEVKPQDVIDYLVKTGVNPERAKKAVKTSFDYANKKYGGPTFKSAVKKIADVVWTLGEEVDLETVSEMRGATSGRRQSRTFPLNKKSEADAFAKKHGGKVEKKDKTLYVTWDLPESVEEGKDLTFRIHKDGKPWKVKGKTVEIYGIVKAKKKVDDLNKKQRGKFTAHHVSKPDDDLYEAKESGMDIARRIVKDKQHEKGVDMQTANFILQIYNKVNDANKKKMDGSSLKQLVGLAQRMMKK
jgi:hypothetical protein